MLIIPAIDLKEGQCVRLQQGRMDQATVFSDDPLKMASHWIDAGCQRLHIVDLDGAIKGHPVNTDVIKRICKNHSHIAIQIGGGIRSLEAAAAYLDAGAEFVIVGTQAIKSPPWVVDMCKQFPGQIIVGLDAKEGQVATEGWTKTADCDVIEIGKRFEDSGVSAIIYTDIVRDGMMVGVNTQATGALAKAIDIPVIASGGVANYQDIKDLQAIGDEVIMGAIVGRALYQGAMDYAKAQQIANLRIN